MTTRGDRVADSMTALMGSWKFIIWQGIILLTWFGFNSIPLFIGYQWDPYPFFFINLAMSMQAAFAAPIIMMSQNRLAASDRNTINEDLEADSESLAILKRLEARLLESSPTE